MSRQPQESCSKSQVKGAPGGGEVPWKPGVACGQDSRLWWASPACSLCSPGLPHWVSSEQPLQSHTKLHMASLGVLQWLGTQAQPGDPAATRETARQSGAG